MRPRRCSRRKRNEPRNTCDYRQGVRPDLDGRLHADRADPGLQSAQAGRTGADRPIHPVRRRCGGAHMTTDPKELDDADPHTGNRDVDPVSGYDTTGHDWGGIKELNTPFPKIALVALALTFVYSVVTWILLPAWPLG